MKQILTFGKYLREKFGVKVYKVPIALSGYTCPNIDGTIARGGCTFCENESFNPTLNKSEQNKSQYINFQTTINPLLNKQLAELEFQFKTITEKLKKNYIKKDSPYNHHFIDVVDFISYEDAIPVYSRMNLNENVKLLPAPKRYYPNKKLYETLNNRYTKFNKLYKQLEGLF